MVKLIGKINKRLQVNQHKKNGWATFKGSNMFPKTYYNFKGVRFHAIGGLHDTIDKACASAEKKPYGAPFADGSLPIYLIVTRMVSGAKKFQLLTDSTVDNANIIRNSVKAAEGTGV